MWCREAVRRTALTICALVATCFLGVARGEGIAWDALSGEQQAVLQSVVKPEQWATLPSDQQERLADGSKRWSEMNTDQRAAAQDRFNTWRNLPPEKRKAIRGQFERYQKM